MRKFVKGALFTTLSMAVVFGLASCGDKEEEKTEKEKTLDFIESLNNVSVDGINAYDTSFDDMVSYLKEEGVISSSATGVNINTTGGFVKKYDGTYTDVVAIADKAFDYGDVALMWWDLENNSQYTSTYEGMQNNNGNIVVDGGMYAYFTTAYVGCFAIAFDSVTEVYNNTQYDSNIDADWDAYQARQKTAINTAKTALGEKLTDFTTIDKTPTSLAFYSITSLASALQKNGSFTVAELANPVDLNKEYSYDVVSDGTTTTKYAKLASTANQYGKIKIYYFDQKEDNFSNLTFSVMLASLISTKSTTLYYDGGSATANLYNAENVFKAASGTKTYSATGTNVTYSVDVVCGNFAFEILE